VTNVPPDVKSACRRAATLRTESLADYPHRVLRADVIALMEYIESLPEVPA
jgi:hypothetical protein